MPGSPPDSRPPRAGAPRRLAPDEEALWRRLARTIKAYAPPAPPPARAEPGPPGSASAPAEPDRRPKGWVPPPRPTPPAPAEPARGPVVMLDRGWEKRIRSGMARPERSVDLHGHSVAAAHMVLDAALRRAIAEGVRVLLVVTGRPRPGRPADGGRGIIRAEIGHWLERSPHADRIASVRVAHPRHGGDGALYVILRRG